MEMPGIKATATKRPVWNAGRTVVQAGFKTEADPGKLVLPKSVPPLAVTYGRRTACLRSVL